MDIIEMPVRARPDGLHKICGDLKGRTSTQEELTEDSIGDSEFVSEHIRYGKLLGFIQQEDGVCSLTERGVSLAYEKGISGPTEPFFLDGLLEDHLYTKFSEQLGDEQRPDPSEITESEVLRIIRLNYDLDGMEEPDLQSGVRTYFLTLEAAGLGEYKLATANTEPRIVFRDDITIEDLADGDADSLRRPGVREVANPSEIFHDGFDEQLLTRISPQFRYGLFQDAVGTAYTVLEDRIRDKGGFTNEDHGKDLMAQAFDGDSGPLAMGNAAAEKEGFKLLYMGAYMSLRNPPSHRILDDMNKQQAQDAISMVNFLLTLVENQK